MLYMAAYGSMLRAPSELLPITAGKNGDADKPLPAGARSRLSLCGTELALRLACRKQRPRGSVLRRGCWCFSRSAGLCPVLALGERASSLPRGRTPFAGVTAGHARALLKSGDEKQPKERNLHDSEK